MIFTQNLLCFLIDKALGLSPLLLMGEACAALSADTSCRAAEGRSLALCSETDHGQDPPTCCRACKADAEMTTISIELKASCCLYLLSFFFLSPLFALLSVHSL